MAPLFLFNFVRENYISYNERRVNNIARLIVVANNVCNLATRKPGLALMVGNVVANLLHI